MVNNCNAKIRCKGFWYFKWNSTKPFFEEAKLKNKINFYKIDIRKKIISDKINGQTDFIFHLAAQALVLESILNPDTTFETNIIGTVNILNSIRKFKHKCCVVIITSDKCYLNKEHKKPYRETDPMGGKDPYSASKAAAEIIFSCYVQTYFKEIKNIKISSARAGNVIGGGDWSTNRVIPDLVKSFSKNKKFIVRNPTSTRPWQPVLEPISGYIFLAHFLNTNKKGINHESFNFAPNKFKNVTVREIIQKIHRNWTIIKPVFQKVKGKKKRVNYFSLIQANQKIFKLAICFNIG